MQIAFKIETWTTQSGKQAVSFSCNHCHMHYCVGDITGFFYQSNIKKDNLEEALQVFVDAINTHTEMELFSKPKTGNKLRNHLCNCDPNIIDLEYCKGVKRANDILSRALEMMNIQSSRD